MWIVSIHVAFLLQSGATNPPRLLVTFDEHCPKLSESRSGVSTSADAQCLQIRFFLSWEWQGHLLASKGSELVFQLQPTPGLVPHHYRTPLPRSRFQVVFGQFRVVSESIACRDSNSTHRRLEIERKTTRNRVLGWFGGGGR